jgi:hypothetical protein
MDEVTVEHVFPQYIGFVQPDSHVPKQNVCYLVRLPRQHSITALGLVWDVIGHAEFVSIYRVDLLDPLTFHLYSSYCNLCLEDGGITFCREIGDLQDSIVSKLKYLKS